MCQGNEPLPLSYIGSFFPKIKNHQTNSQICYNFVHRNILVTLLQIQIHTPERVKNMFQNQHPKLSSWEDVIPGSASGKKVWAQNISICFLVWLHQNIYFLTPLLLVKHFRKCIRNMKKKYLKKYECAKVQRRKGHSSPSAPAHLVFAAPSPPQTPYLHLLSS